MKTGLIESWGAPDGAGPLYPFVGSEVALTVIAAMLWLAWHVWQMRSESKALEKEVQEIRRAKRESELDGN